MRSVHIIISGKVHGVFFRATAKRIADTLHLSGWVKNTMNAVEIKASGKNDEIAEFIEWCHHGPDKAIVSAVTITDIESESESFKGFSIDR